MYEYMYNVYDDDDGVCNLRIIGNRRRKFKGYIVI